MWRDGSNFREVEDSLYFKELNLEVKFVCLIYFRERGKKKKKRLSFPTPEYWKQILRESEWLKSGVLWEAAHTKRSEDPLAYLIGRVSNDSEI